MSSCDKYIFMHNGKNKKLSGLLTYLRLSLQSATTSKRESYNVKHAFTLLGVLGVEKAHTPYYQVT